MSKILSPTEFLIQDFISNVYNSDKKNILFWDSCALLEILRFPYRGWDANTYDILNKLNGLIHRSDIYSLASSLTITEWNDNEEEIRNTTQTSLEETHNYHSTCIDVLNKIHSTSYASETIQDKSLVNTLDILANSILSKTLFIKTEEVANNALERVKKKLPPSKKKAEFKDCTIWETVLYLSREIYKIDTVNKQAFFTVNVEDFVNKSLTPPIFHHLLTTEAAESNLICCHKFEQVNVVL